MINSLGQRLEQYTIKRPQELLVVTIEIEGETDQIAIYKGFSSSLVRATEFNPDISLISDSAEIVRIDRVKAPYQPNHPEYIQTGLTWETMQPLLAEVSI
ncbi:DUF7734 family protein [Merismopedia glauca]|uniref:DUF7734 domain-containing protein n=1 Tax=Merismopedia glauca CCAP 1448/3 TaxID=1296344 RepID=A0A2T1BZ60_9CYAN|nr:hypothetical protein [Merismopedia glauca]PSB01315.1 hypothetical protein C7B64_19010 [Merismopedia glauca CCAP 1448/3]